jgi:hypothetical protein
LPKNVKIRICNTIILPLILYGCDNWSPTLSEERRLKVLDSSPSIIRMMKSMMRGAEHVVNKRVAVCMVICGKARRKEATRRTKM